MKKTIVAVASLLMGGAAYGQTSETFNTFMSNLATAPSPLASGDVFYVMHNGASQQVLKKNVVPEVVNVVDYGVKCDGSTDDAANLQTAFTAGAGKLIILPAGTCNFSTTLFLLGTGTSLRGAGRSATILRSTFKTGDELHIGDSTSCPINGNCAAVATYNYHLSDFTIFSTVTRTNGYTMWIHNADEVFIDNVENNDDLLNAYSGGNVHYSGIFSDHSGSTHIDHSEFWAQGDVWTITQSTDSSLHSTNLRYGTVGVRLAGGAQGFHCTQSNIESNTNNVLVDNTISTLVTNQNAVFGAACFMDTAGADNFVVNTALGGLVNYQFSGTSIATQNGAAVRIISAPNESYFIFDNVVIGSYSGVGVGDGIRQDDCTPKILITGGTVIFHNSGYGIRQTCTPSSPNSMYIASDTTFASNTLGNTSFTLSTVTGGADPIRLSSSGTLTMSVNNSGVLWQIQTDGRIFAGVDNTYDIGASASNRPRTIYAGTSLIAPTVQSATTLTLAANAGGNLWQIQIDGRIFAGVDNSYDIGASASNRPRTIYAGTSFVAPLTTPASTSAACTAGQVAWDAGFLYVCYQTNGWKRVATATW